MSQGPFPGIRKLYSLYSRNLQLYHPDLIDEFACPICLKTFTGAAIDADLLSIAHVIPESIGGRLETLTCKQCNSNLGASADAHLVHRLRVEDILAGVSDRPLRSRIRVDQGEFTADVYLRKGESPEITIVGIPQHSNPKKHQLAQAEFETSGGREFSLSARLGYREPHSQVAIIHSAYLLLFYYFGYGYIGFDIANQVRFQINHPEQKTPVLAGIVPLYDVKNLRPGHGAVSIINGHNGFRSFFVVLNLSTVQPRYVGVIMPGLDESGKGIFDVLQENGLEQTIGNSPRFSHIRYSADSITDSNRKHLAYLLWQLNKKEVPNEPL